MSQQPVSNHQQTPPKDPDLRSPQEREQSWSNSTQQTPTSTTFPVSNSSHDISKSLILTDLTDDSERTAEMEARRQALLISQMKRKEKISAFKEDKRNGIV